MEKNITDNSKMGKNLEWESTFFLIMKPMKDSGLMEKGKVMDFINGIMGISLKVNGKMIKLMDMGFFFFCFLFIFICFFFFF